MFSSKFCNLNQNSILFIQNIVRNSSTKPTTNGDILPMICNKNPRNLERLRLARKPSGYGVENKEMNYWHRLVLNSNSRCLVAQIVHYTNRVVVEASTKEWGIEKQLYSRTDKQAYIVLAKVLAERCLETGIYSFYCGEKKEWNNDDDDIDGKNNESSSNLKTFFHTLQAEGLMLSEPPLYEPEKVWNREREKKPWTVLED